MGVSKSGYYKWLARCDRGQNKNRKDVIELVASIHKEHRTHGYRWVNAYIRINYHQTFSDNYIYKIFRFLNIQAETKHKVKRHPRKIRDQYPNLIFSTWETVDRPRQVIVSDMTAFTISSSYYEITFYFDVFTKEILTWHIGKRRGDRDQYIDGLKDIKALLELEGCKEPIIIHTDQGSVYSSKAYNDLIKDTNMQRSMSRAGKPTDNPVNEALNGWIKEELLIDFRLSDSTDLPAVITKYVKYFNHERPCYAIGYDTPAHYFQRYQNGEIKRKNTFENRSLSEVPKYVQVRKNETDNLVP